MQHQLALTLTAVVRKTNNPAGTSQKQRQFINRVRRWQSYNICKTHTRKIAGNCKRFLIAVMTDIYIFTGDMVQLSWFNVEGKNRGLLHIYGSTGALMVICKQISGFVLLYFSQNLQ